MPLLVAVLLAGYGYCSQGCCDQCGLEPDLCDAGRIEGVWQDEHAPFWFYEFHSPHLRQWVEFCGAVVTEQEYIYGTRADTLWASGPGGERTWLLCFTSDTTAEYREWDVFKLSPGYVIVRR